MLEKTAARLSAAAKMPPKLAAAKLLGRLGMRGAWLDRTSFLAAPDVQRPNKAPDILFGALRQAEIGERALLDRIPGGTVLEVGCGRYAGFAPSAVSWGAEAYIGADPSVDGALLRHPQIVAGYVEPALAAAMGEGGAPVPVEDFFARCRFETTGVAEALTGAERVDVCVSVSCLEHIGDLPAAARALAEVSAPGAVHAHLVNFSNHLYKARPFAHLYEMPNDAFGQAFDGIVNGLRLPDLERVFEVAGLPMRAVPLSIVPEALPERIDPSWTGRYDRDVLAIRTAMLYREG